VSQFHLAVPQLELSEFQRISNYIQQECGIRLGIEKKVMVESRLQSRLRVLGLSAFNEYISLVFDSGNNNPEIYHMIDKITTNKTDFFREAIHFEYLNENVLPEFYNHQSGNPFRVWSAGCSSGEEPFTIAMVIEEFKEQNPGFNYSILGTDLSSSMVEKAKTAIYSDQKAEQIPSLLRKKYLLKSIDRDHKRIRIAPEIRQNVFFERANLIKDSLSGYGTFEVIFCRNVLIYFDRQTQLKVVESLCQQLLPGAYLFVGHSEALTNLDLPLKQIKPSLYKKF
jgi:chemotaxis protein methyltransferase CheR